MKQERARNDDAQAGHGLLEGLQKSAEARDDHVAASLGLLKRIEDEQARTRLVAHAGQQAAKSLRSAASHHLAASAGPLDAAGARAAMG